MAGRSGAAAIEMELREAAASFVKFVPTLAKQLESKNADLAKSLLAVKDQKPTNMRQEDEMYLQYTEAAEATITKSDVTDEFGEIAYGVEIHCNGSQVVGVSLYLQ